MDELVEYLRREGGSRIIAGKQDCNLLILGDGSGTFTRVKALLLTVGSPEGFTDGVEAGLERLRAAYEADEVFRRLVQCGRVLACQREIPLLMVGYPCRLLRGPDGLTVFPTTFLAKQVVPAGEARQCTGLELADWLYRKMGVRFADAGTSKAENRSLADAFHRWSRENLSGFVVKQDFDAVYWKRSSGRFAMIEVKRSPVMSIDRWRPYREDIRNYDIQSRFAKELGAPFYTFHHQGGPCDENTPVGCYEVLDVDPREQGSGWMRYHRTVRPAGELLELLETGR